VRGWKETQEILCITKISTYFNVRRSRGKSGQGYVICCFVLKVGKNTLCLLNFPAGKFNISICFELEPSVLLKFI